jgi:hypothetical protein
MRRWHFALLVLVLVLAAQPLFATTYYVAPPLANPCTSAKGGFEVFPSIQYAVTHVPEGSTINICPGTYNEQVTISQSLTLKGVSFGDSSKVVIAVPPGGLAVNATSDYGVSLAAQVVVQNATGMVSVSDLTVDGTGNNVTSGLIVGVFYQNSSGAINHLIIQNQNGADCGYGVWLEGGSNKPSVNLENSYLQGLGCGGIEVETNSSTSELTATIKANILTMLGDNGDNVIELDSGATATVSNNLILGGGTGISVRSGGAISNNTIFSARFGIGVGSDEPSVTSNLIYNSTEYGITLGSAVAPVTDNTIVQSVSGIGLFCTGGNNVHSNTIMGAQYGLIGEPNGANPVNFFYNVGAISPGGC